MTGSLEVMLCRPLHARSLRLSGLPAHCECWLARSLKKMRKLLVLLAMIAAALPVVPSNAARPERVDFIKPVGDLDGDGRSDVVAHQVGRATTLVARRGVNGSVLWRRTYESAIPFAVALGPNSNGVLVISNIKGVCWLTWTHECMAGDLNAGRRIEVLDSRGTRLWSLELWRRESDGSSTELYRPIAIDQFASRDGSEILMHRLVNESTGPRSVLASSIEVRSVATGAIISSPVTNAFDGTTLAAAGDLSGDGFIDYATISTDQSYSFLNAFSGADGRLMWRGPLSFERGSIVPAGDLTGDGTADLLAWSFASKNSPSKTISLDGRTGMQISEWPYVDPAAIGDVDRDGKGDIAFWTSGWSGRRRQMTYRVVRSAGSNVLTKTYTAQFVGIDSARGGMPLGDVDGDGVQDVELTFDVVTSTAHVVRRFLLNGRTGAIRSMDPGAMPLLQTLDGHGTDLLVTARAGRGGQLRGVDGKTGKVLWRRTTRSEPRRELICGAADLTGDGRAETCVLDDAGNVLILSGRDGRAIWTIAQPW